MNNWNQIAKLYGFISPFDLLNHFYIDMKLSASQISRKVNTTRQSVCAELQRLHIPMRKKGGNNNHNWRDGKIV